MIGLEITLKESGLPVFTYEFQPDTLFNSDIRGGLITAIMQVMDETFGHQETKIVNYGHYNAILVEGSFVYGTLFTFQTGPVIEKFIAKLVAIFEKRFWSDLESTVTGASIINPDEFDFSEECSKAYKSLSHIDVSNLSKLLDSIQFYGDNVFENILIFTRPDMSQIYTHLISERFSAFGNEVSKAIKTVLDLANRTSFPIASFHIALSNNFHCLMFNIFPYSVIVFVEEDDLALTHWRIQEIKDAFAVG
ncbi:MAG: hypothetical protein ACXAB2_08515 [Candidatus Hodarchaeales archaeon]|jgi:hypothetical protein